MQFYNYCFPGSISNSYQNGFALTRNSRTEENRIIAHIAQGIFAALKSYALENLPFLIFHATHIVYPSLIATILHHPTFAKLFDAGSFMFLLYEGPGSGKERIFFRIQKAGTVAMFAQFLLSLISPCPIGLGMHVTLRVIIYTAGVVGNSRAIYQGVSKIRQAFTQSQLSTSKKTELVVSGLISAGLGTWGLSTTTQNAFNLYKGLKAYWKLDATQQFFVLKFQALESLGQIKSQHAVIIHGLSGEWAKEGYSFHDSAPHAPNYVIYQNYNTRTYQINSSHNLEQVLQIASKELGGKLDLIALMGHANNTSMKLNANYDFTANRIEVQALQQNLSPIGQILLWGCETAKPGRKFNSLTSFISKSLPKATVIGFNQSLYSAYSFVWFKGKELHIYAKEEKTFRGITAIYQGGHQVIR
jgi:hypothetical protein